MPSSEKASARIENRLLAALSTESYESLAAHLERVELPLAKVLYAPQGRLNMSTSHLELLYRLLIF